MKKEKREFSAKENRMKKKTLYISMNSFKNSDTLNEWLGDIHHNMKLIYTLPRHTGHLPKTISSSSMVTLDGGCPAYRITRCTRLQAAISPRHMTAFRYSWLAFPSPLYRDLCCGDGCSKLNRGRPGELVLAMACETRAEKRRDKGSHVLRHGTHTWGAILLLP